MKNACITGANRGIGLALAKQLSNSYHVFGLCRQESKELLELPNTTCIANTDINHHDDHLAAINQIQNIDLLEGECKTQQCNERGLKFLKHSLFFTFFA